MGWPACRAYRQTPLVNRHDSGKTDSTLGKCPDNPHILILFHAPPMSTLFPPLCAPGIKPPPRFPRKAPTSNRALPTPRYFPLSAFTFPPASTAATLGSEDLKAA